MPPPVIMFRVLIYFVVLVGVVIGIAWLLRWLFGIEFRYIIKLQEWHREQKQKRYDKKFKELR